MITKWSSLTPKDPWVSLSELVEQWDEDSLSSPWDLISDVVVLVDEAQKTYDDYVLWNCHFDGVASVGGNGRGLLYPETSDS